MKSTKVLPSENKNSSSIKPDVQFIEDEETGAIIDVTITTERFYIKGIHSKRVDIYHQHLYNDPIVMEKYGYGVVRNLYEPTIVIIKEKEKNNEISLKPMIELYNAWEKRFKEGDPFTAYEVNNSSDDCYVGEILQGHGENKNESDLSYLFAKKYWASGPLQKGTGREVVHAMVGEQGYVEYLINNGYKVGGKNSTNDVKKIVATARTDNIASVKILEKEGFKPTGQINKFGCLRTKYEKSINMP